MNRGFLYGDGFFESIRFHNDSIPLLPQHVERINEALEVYGMKWEAEDHQNALISMLSEAPKDVNTCRISFYRSGAGKYTPLVNKAETHLSWSTQVDPFWLPIRLDLDAQLSELRAGSGKLAIFPDPKPIHPLFRYKSLSSAYYVLAAQYALHHGIDHLILTDAQGMVLEEVRSNLLFQKGDELIVPPPDNGSVVGATLRYLLRNYGFQLQQRPIHHSELGSFDAIYRCKATTGIDRIK